MNFFRPPISTPGFVSQEYLKGVDCGHCLQECFLAQYIVVTKSPQAMSDGSEMRRSVPRTLVDLYFSGPNAGVLYKIVPTVTQGNLLGRLRSQQCTAETAQFRHCI